MTRSRLILIVLGISAFGVPVMLSSLANYVNEFDPFLNQYNENCSVCHGEQLEGTAQGPALVGVDLRHGESIIEIQQSVSQGFPDQGMPSWSSALSQAEIRSLAIYIAERRADRSWVDFKVLAPITVPTGPQQSEQHDFLVETVTTDLSPTPFSIAPLPAGKHTAK